MISENGYVSKTKIAILPAFRAMDTHDLRKGLPFEIRNRNFASIHVMDARDLRRRLHFEIRNRNFTSISRDGHARSPQKVALRNQKSCTLPAFRAIDTHDLRRRLHFEIRNHNFTDISHDGHARSPQRVVLQNQKMQLYQHSVHSTPTISTEGSHFETMLQKYCACHEIMSRGHTKCYTGHAIISPSSSSKNATPLRN